MDLPNYVSMHFFSRDFELLKMSEATFTPKHGINQMGGLRKSNEKDYARWKLGAINWQNLLKIATFLNTFRNKALLVRSQTAIFGHTSFRYDFVRSDWAFRTGRLIKLSGFFMYSNGLFLQEYSPVRTRCTVSLTLLIMTQILCRAPTRLSLMMSRHFLSPWQLSLTLTSELR